MKILSVDTKEKEAWVKISTKTKIFNLELSEEEAVFIYQICACIEGSSTESRRAIADEIRNMFHGHFSSLSYDDLNGFITVWPRIK